MNNPRFAEPRAAYIHVPFCRHRCPYCNFTVAAGRDDRIDDYLRALDIELSWLERPREIETLYLGGGTPTHLSPVQLRALLGSVRKWFIPATTWEFTVEANPADVTGQRMQVLQEFGVTRVSLGVQSFQERKLAFLERDHRAAEIGAAARRIRQVGVALAVDLIFGVPDETTSEWQNDLKNIEQLAAEHVSTYGLTIERGTRLFGRTLRRELIPLGDEQERTLFEIAIDYLVSAGWEHYEISNFAVPGCRSRHNLAYWTGRCYYAAGPGASRHVAGRRETNHRSVSTYLRRVLSGRSPVQEVEMLSDEDAARERLVLGLRMRDGVPKERFQRETTFHADQLLGPCRQQLVDEGLLEDVGDRLRLTRAGLMVSDAIWPWLLRA